jgi:iron complex outermembrane receptor protein
LYPVLVSFVVPGLAWAGGTVFHIAGGPAPAALSEFSAQAKFQILFDFTLVKERRTRAVDGEFEPTVALAALLDGSGLTFSVVNDRTVTIVSVPGVSANVAAARPIPHTRSLRGGAPGSSLDDARGLSLETVEIQATHADDSYVAGSHLIQLSRDAIEESGASSVPDLLRTLPQNFGGGPTPDTRDIERETVTNIGRGVSLNLRGAGAHATVALIDDRRIAPSGSAGAFEDVSNIPISAIERIDILPEAGSIRFGADGIGGVANFRLRQEMQGAESIASVGSASDGTLGETRLSQASGWNRDGAHGVVAFEYFQSAALPADERRQGSSDLSPYGGSNFDTPNSNPGTLIVGGQTWAIPAAQNGMALTVGALTPGTQNLENLLKGADLIAGQRHFSFATTSHFALSGDTTVFIDVLGTQRDAHQNAPGVRLDLQVPVSNPFYLNPTGGSGPVTVAYDFASDLGTSAARVRVRTLNAAFGFDAELSHSWHLRVYEALALEGEIVHEHGLVNPAALAAALADPNPSTAFNPFGAGSHSNPATLESIRSTSLSKSNSILASADATADGPIFETPAGIATLTVGADIRRQTFRSLLSGQANPLPTEIFHQRLVGAAFGQLHAPLIGAGNLQSGSPRLELTVGARSEQYSDIGFLIRPTAQMRWQAMRGLALRGAWGQYMSAPLLSDLDEFENGSVRLTLPDAASPTGSTSVLAWYGNNKDLRAESSTSWSLGTDFAPPALSGLTISATYFQITSKDRIQNIAFSSALLNDPTYRDVVIRNPTAVQLQRVCARSTYLGSASACSTEPVGAIVDLRTQNLGVLTTRGLDLNADFRWEDSFGHFDVGLDGTYLLQYAEAATPVAPLIEVLNTQNNPIALRMRSLFRWHVRGFGASVSLNYTGHYRDVISQPNRGVASLTTTDLTFHYEPRVSFLGGIRFTFSVQNVFDRGPPFLNNPLGEGYDAENADLWGRYLRFIVRKVW